MPKNATQRRANRQGHEVALALLLLTIVALIILPVPSALLDALIMLNLAASLILLMIPLYTSSQTALSTFPSLLLFTTLFRLSLNIAATKQILMHAHAGHIIETFGKLVVGGNVIVGLIVFLIIAIVQFIVISKGGERVAEVGARFALDAMPGKQMSIDADLRAGNITAEEAQRRRDRLDQESKLHGAMDGAMKFVKGDAIAAVIIALVNIIGGICIGALINGMTLAESLARYTVLTVGEGMVSQLPSLFVSVAAGIVITRVSSKENEGLSLGTEIGRQLGASPRALITSAVILAMFALVPGFPKVQFLLLAALLGYAAYKVVRDNVPAFEDAEMKSMDRDGAPLGPAKLVDDASARLAAPLRVRCAADIRAQLDPAGFDAALATQRRELHMRAGLPFPGLKFLIDDDLAEGEFAIDVQELQVARGRCEELLARARAARPEATLAEALAQRLGETIRRHAGDFIGLQETQTLLNALEKEMPDLIGEISRTVATMRVAETLNGLASEGVSLRHMRETLEHLLVWAPREREAHQVLEMVRVGIGKFVVAPYLDPNNELQAHLLSPDLEVALRSATPPHSPGAAPALSVEVARDAREAVARLRQGLGPDRALVVVCGQDVRRHVHGLLRHDEGRVAALSFQEIPPTVVVKVLGYLGEAPPAVQQAA